jgi:hypothetical protein
MKAMEFLLFQLLILRSSAENALQFIGEMKGGKKVIAYTEDYMFAANVKQ